MLNLARDYKAQFLHASSECYGDREAHPQSESYWGRVNPIGPRSVYDESSIHTPVNIGNPTEFTMIECADEVLLLTGSKSAIVHKPLPQDDPTRRRPHIAKARLHLEWEPKISLREGLEMSLAYFQACVANETNVLTHAVQL